MNRMNRKLEYTLMALKYMSQKPIEQLTTAKEITEKYHVPFDATAKVMQLMASRGLLKSEQGVAGGYRIQKNLSELNMQQLIEMIEGPTQIAKCIQLQKAESIGCDLSSSCNIKSPMSTLNVRLNDFYKGINLQELLAKS